MQRQNRQQQSKNIRQRKRAAEKIEILRQLRSKFLDIVQSSTVGLLIGMPLTMQNSAEVKLVECQIVQLIMKSLETRLSVNDIISFMVLRVFTDHQGCLKSIKPESGVNMFVLAITSIEAKCTRLGHQACIPSAWENHMWSVTALPFRLESEKLAAMRMAQQEQERRASTLYFPVVLSCILSVFCRPFQWRRADNESREDVTWTRVQEDYFRQQILGNTGALVRDVFTQPKTAFYAEWVFEHYTLIFMKLEVDWMC